MLIYKLTLQNSMKPIITVLFSFFLLANTSGQKADTNLKISHLTGDFYIYTTYNLYKGSRIGANGMYLVTSKGVVMFDSPWDSTQFQPLLDSIKLKHNKTVVLCIATHFHADRTGGLEYYRQKGIATYTTMQTDALSQKNQMKRAEFLIAKDTTFSVGQYSFQIYYPGPGHAPDNIIAWFEKEKVLYGGCLIKSWENKDLGFLGDANTKEYANTIKKVQQKCRNPKFVIPGHDDWNKISSLEHTLEMADELRKKN